MDNLKLRLSYGSLGNQASVGYYDYMQLINTGSQLNYKFGGSSKAYYASESAPNASDMTWETVITKNIGLDMGFLGNRLNVGFDAYIRDTKDMLMPGKTLPAVYGASSPKMNAADLRTKGWELSATWDDSFVVVYLEGAGFVTAAGSAWGLSQVKPGDSVQVYGQYSGSVFAATLVVRL